VELTGGGLTREGFEALLQRLDPDRERAGEKYEGLRSRLRKFFEWRGGRQPEEMADEAIDRACRRIAAGEVIRAEDPAQYVLGVARNVLRESWKRETRTPVVLRDPDLLITAQEDAPSAADEGRFACLQACLEALPPETARLVLEYYGEGGRDRILKRKGLAAVLGIPGGALRVRLHRVRARLEGCVARCLRGRSETPGVAQPHQGGGGVRGRSS
jgi:DNA-directed RNA polymerase specialized sigma24 family protein